MKSQIFTEDDFLKRQEIARCNMEKAGLTGMVLSSEANVSYYTGYRTHAPWKAFTRPQFLFFPVDGKPLLYTQTFVTPEATEVAAGCDNRNFNTLLGPTGSDIADICCELGMEEGKIGFELGLEQRVNYPVQTWEELKHELKRAELVDCAPLLWEQKMIKSAKEVECIRRACNATGYAFDHLFSSITPGMTEREISMLAQKLMLEGGAEYPGFVVITSGEGNYGRISSVSSDRVPQKGDMIWMDLGADYNGYWSDFCRAAVMGPVSDSRKKRQADVVEITAEAASFMRPGVPVSEVARACGAALEKRGYSATYDCGRMGHGFGMLSTEPPSVTVRDQDVLKEGMIIALEPGILDEDGVFVVEENYVITEEGCERLSCGRRELFSISC